MFKKFGYALGASVAALALAPAANAAIFIGIAVNGGAITQVATDAGTGRAAYNADNGGYFFDVTGTGMPRLQMGTLNTQSLNIQNQGGENAVIDVYITQTDVSLQSGGLLTTFTSNTVSGVTATLTSYYDDNNNTFTGNTLAQAVFTGPGATSSANPISVSGTWSETVRYRLNFTGGNGSNFNGTVNLTAVPEPTTWAMFILGFGVMGAGMRRRNAQVRVAKASLRFA